MLVFQLNPVNTERLLCTKVCKDSLPRLLWQHLSKEGGGDAVNDLMGTCTGVAGRRVTCRAGHSKI